MKYHFIILAALGFFSALQAAPDAAARPTAATAVRKIQLLPETGVYKEGEGVAVVQALCITCHSTEYVSSQPAMPEKYWDATVKKMKEKFAAPIPPEAIPGLVKYLSENYGAKK